MTRRRRSSRKLRWCVWRQGLAELEEEVAVPAAATEAALVQAMAAVQGERR